MIEYVDSADGIKAEQLHGFFVGWTNPETHLELLKNSDEVILALDAENGNVVGFITAITDNMLAAYIPLLEVLPAYQKQQIGTALMKKNAGAFAAEVMVEAILRAVRRAEPDGGLPGLNKTQ